MNDSTFCLSDHRMILIFIPGQCKTFILDSLCSPEDNQVTSAQLPRCPDASTEMGHRIQNKHQGQSLSKEAVQEANPRLG